jgi:hypothetical protein
VTEKFRPVEHERQTQLWRGLMRHVEERITELRQRNDADQDERATANLRGRIAELKALLALDKPEP